MEMIEITRREWMNISKEVDTVPALAEQVTKQLTSCSKTFNKQLNDQISIVMSARGIRIYEYHQRGEIHIKGCRCCSSLFVDKEEVLQWSVPGKCMGMRYEIRGVKNAKQTTD